MASSRRVKGITVEIGGDTTKLSDALRDVNQNINSTQSQLKDVERLLKLDPTNTELLSQKQRLLGEAVQETSGRLETLKTASEQAAQTKDNYDAWKAKYDPIKEEIDKTSEKLKDLKEQAEKAQKQFSDGEISQEQYDAIQREINETSDKLKELKQSAKDVSDEFGNPVSPEQYDSLQREIIETEQELQRLQREADTSTGALGKLAAVGEKMQELGDTISGVGEKLMPLTTVIAGIAGVAVKEGSSFDSQMSKVQAIVGEVTNDELAELIDAANEMELSFEYGADATETAMNIIRAKARQMSRDTKYTAAESGQAFEYMAMAGWEPVEMLEGIEGNMYLAAASGEELALTSDIVTDAMTALGMSADEASHFADVLATASSNANTNVALMGESFKYVAPVAGAMGFSAEDLATSIGVMANAGIKGSQAGNSLKNGLVNLMKPTKQMQDAMKALGLIETETIQKFDSEKIVKAQSQVADKMSILEKKQLAYNTAVQKYGEKSTQAQTALLSMQNAEQKLEEAQEALTKAQEGTTEVVSTGRNAFTNADGSIKSMSGILDVLRGTLGAVDVELTDAEGNMRDADDIISELEQSENGLVQAEQMRNAAIIFGKQNLPGWLALINESEENYNDLTEAIYDCDGTAQEMAETMQDNLGGQITILKSQLSDLMYDIYSLLVPSLREIVTKIQEVVTKLSALSPETKNLIVKIALIAAAIGPALVVIGKVIATVGTILTIIPKIVNAINLVRGAMSAMNLTFLTNPVFLVIAAITALVAAFVHFWNTSEEFRNFWIGLWAEIQETLYGFFDAWTSGWETVQEFFRSTWESLKSFFIGIGTFFKEFWDSIKETLYGFFDTWVSGWNSIRDFLTGLWETITSIAANAWSNLVSVFESVYNVFKPLLDAFAYLFETIFMAIQILVGRAMDWIREKISSVWSAIVSFLTPILESIWTFFGTIWNGILNIISTVIISIYNDISAKWNLISNIISIVLTAIKVAVSEAWESIKSKISTALTLIKTIVTNSMNAIKTTISDIWENVKSAVAEKISSIKDVIRDGLNQAKEHVLNIAKDAWNWGSDIVTGIIDGIKSKIQDLANGVIDVANTIREYLHFSVPDKGPLTDFESWMPDFMKGLADGIQSSQKYIDAAIEGVSEAMQLTLQSDMRYSLGDFPELSANGTGGIVNNYYNNDNSQIFTQNNTSPKALSRWELNRQARNILELAKR